MTYKSVADGDIFQVFVFGTILFFEEFLYFWLVLELFIENVEKRVLLFF